jgi:uncharacterized protein (TIGR00255 family)
MPLSSMTGFARSSGAHDGLHWQWEVKSVNGKALDVRCRLPQGFDGLEPALRITAAGHLKRGNLQVSLSVSGLSAAETVTVNREALDRVTAAAQALHERIGGEPPRADALLALRGVLEISQPETDAAEIERRNQAMAASFEEAIVALDVSRRAEGSRLQAILEDQIDRIEGLSRASRDHPARSPEAVKTRLAEQVSRLMETGVAFDRDRLHQEAALIATRADIQEELDRLFSHVAAARALLAAPEAIGRKFDFLAQEFNREANTLCSKAIDSTLTQIGLELKSVIDQLREQVQNVE